MKIKKQIYLILLLLSSSMAKAQFDTLYYEDFSDSTLSNWTVVDSTNRGENWIWSKTYLGGHWRPNTAALNSTTSSNGFIFFPADFYNTPYNPPTSGIDTMDAWISSKAIPISPSSMVEIRFNQYLSFCCQPYGINAGIELQVSSDSANWTPYDVTSLLARSGTTNNSELQIHDVSSALMGEDTAYIRFRFSKNGWYYWMIDDVYLLGSIITSIEEQLALKPVHVYPNPSRGMFNVYGADDIDQIEVRDLNGRLVHHQDWSNNDRSINLSFLEDGLYFLRFRGDLERVEKVLIQK